MAAVTARNYRGARNGRPWHEQYPELGTDPVPIEPYLSPECFELERDRIFRKVWLNVGREEEIPEPGDYLVKDMAVCKTSILVVRGKDGRLRAFHNMCSHRGNKVVWERQGASCQNFTCKFHGWTYGLDGQLIFVPDEESFFDLKKGEHGLTPVAADTWQGFIFINLDPNPSETLTEFLGEWGERLSGYPFAEYSATRFTWQTELRANWKLIVDSFSEGYHVPFLHGLSFPDTATSEDNPFSHALDIKLYDRHRTYSVYANPEHKQTPTEAFASRFGTLYIRNDFSMQHLPPGLNPTGSQSWFLDAHAVFPNFFAVVGVGTYSTHNMWPITVDRSVWEVRMYFPEAQTPGQRFSQEFSKVLLRDPLMQDGSTLETSQSVLASGAKTHFILQDQELLIRHFHKVHEDCVGFRGARKEGKSRV